MKRILTFALLICGLWTLPAQGYRFTTLASVPETPVKDQWRTGTCWCFGTTSFLESELLRMGKGTWDLSEMYSVRGTYLDRYRDNYIRNGKGNLGPGAICHTLINAVAKYGLLTEATYSGLSYGLPRHDHTELHRYMSAIAEAQVEMKTTSAESRELVKALLDIYLGEDPGYEIVNGQKMTPTEFRDYLGLDMSHYVELTSFSHHPFYEKCTVEVPDNWEHYDDYYNLPLDELMEVMQYALLHGYSIAWDGDLDGKNFGHYTSGVAIKPATNDPKLLEEIYKWEKPCEEAKVDQAMRQDLFERFVTEDDHIMHLTGLAKDQNGTLYYYTKNSFGTNNKYNGHVYMSDAYVRTNTIGILLHKDAIPQAIRKKLNL